MTEPLREPLSSVLCWIQGLGRKPRGWRADVGGSAAGQHLPPPPKRYQPALEKCTPPSADPLQCPIAAAQTPSFRSQTPESAGAELSLCWTLSHGQFSKGSSLGDASGPTSWQCCALPAWRALSSGGHED